MACADQWPHPAQTGANTLVSQISSKRDQLLSFACSIEILRLGIIRKKLGATVFTESAINNGFGVTILYCFAMMSI